jgi:hypothetical protein
MARYVTRFELTNPVNDYDAAADYLREPMTEYLIDDLDYLHLEHLQGKIENIEWVLEDEESGYIELTTTEPIAWDDLVKISDWVRGQCSDGLGEGFEQQPFAEVRYEDEEDEYGYSNYDTDMASFDWRTNKYRFIKVSDSRKAEKDLTDEELDFIGLTRDQVQGAADEFGVSPRAVAAWYGEWRGMTDEDYKAGEKFDRLLKKTMGRKAYDRADIDAELPNCVWDKNVRNYYMTGGRTLYEQEQGVDADF